jgi:hypothetical protein
MAWMGFLYQNPAPAKTERTNGGSRHLFRRGEAREFCYFRRRFSIPISGPGTPGLQNIHPPPTMIRQTVSRYFSRLTAVSCCLLAVSLLSSCEVGPDDGYIARTNLSLGHMMNAAYEGAPLYAHQKPSYRYPRDTGFYEGPAGVPQGRSMGWNSHGHSPASHPAAPAFSPHTGGYGGHHVPRVTGDEYEHGHSRGSTPYPTGAQRKHVNIYP